MTSSYSQYDRDLKPTEDSRVEMDKVANLVRYRFAGDTRVYEVLEQALLAKMLKRKLSQYDALQYFAKAQRESDRFLTAPSNGKGI